MNPATILIPSYLDPARALLAASKALVDSPPELRVLIVDDGSHGDVWHGVQTPPRVTLVQRARRGGFAKCVNTGLGAIPTGDVVLLNSDVQLSPGWLACVQETAAYEHVALVGIRLHYPDGTLQHAGGVPLPNGWFGHLGEGHGSSLAMMQVYGCPFVTAAFWYWKRSTIERFGGLDEAYWMGVEDIDYCVQLWRAGKTVMYDGRASGIHECGATRRDAGLPVGVESTENVRRFFRKHWPGMDIALGAPAQSTGALRVPSAGEPVRKPPPDSVRGRVRSWLERHAHRLQGPVLEVGSARPVEAWWRDHRSLRPDLRWIGVDRSPGAGVDVVADAMELPYQDGTVGSVVCSEVLEHVFEPRNVLAELARVLEPGGIVVLTTLFAFPYHAFPEDYWRFSEPCLARLLEDAGFEGVETGRAGVIQLALNDHGEPGVQHRELPMHVFACGRRRQML